MKEIILSQEKYKSEMYQNISHDFKTPITVIKSYIEAYNDGIEGYDKNGQYGELTVNKQGQEIIRDNTQLQLEGAQVNAARAQNEVFEAERNKYYMDFIHQNAQFLENQNTKVGGSGYGAFTYTDDDAMIAGMKEIEQL